jgi:GT2 family glycosyltransferase
MDLSIVIVAFRSQDKLRTTLRSVFASNLGDYTYETFVVDNDSRDGTADMAEAEFPDVRLIRNANNGFSKGNNIAIRQATGEYILLLNPDTELEPDTLRLCLDRIAADPTIGILGCRLIKGDSTLDLACRRSFPNPANALLRFSGLSKLFPKSKLAAGYNLTFTDENKEMDVDAVSGAFTLIRASVVQKIGLLDEDFFMYGEDIDWCYRVKQAGFRVLYFPRAVCRHYKGSSSRKAPYSALYAFHDAMWIFYRKHYRQRYPFVLNWLVWAGIWARFSALVTMNFFRREKFVSR